MTRTLDDWLDYQQRIHPRAVALGLDRVGEVWQALGAPRGAPTVVTVAGTNGKGSTVAFLEAIFAESGLRVGAYTSPHLLRYNERVRVEGAEAPDAALIDAFARIEAARGDIELTYFEFGTLAALLVFETAKLDVALLEVGLGGRLDAVNIVDTDAAIVTTVDLDHMDWLGADRDAIASEKAGIFRAGRPAVIGERSPPTPLIAHALAIGARIVRSGVDYRYSRRADGWSLALRASTTLALPHPTLAAPSQYDNAAVAIAAIHALPREHVPFDPAAIARGVARASLPGRLQTIRTSPDVIVDVGHNPQAARELGAWLAANRARFRRVHAVFAALADKDLAGIVAALAGAFDAWHLAGLERESPRGADIATLVARTREALGGRPCSAHTDVASALEAALASAAPDDLVLAFGSFYTVAATLRELAPERASRTV